MRLIHRRCEGEEIRPGFNWLWSMANIILVFRAGRLTIYYRRRRKGFYTAILKRNIFSVDWRQK